MPFAYKLCIALCAILSAVEHCNFQRLFIITRRNCTTLELKEKVDLYRRVLFNWFIKFHIETGIAWVDTEGRGGRAGDPDPLAKSQNYMVSQ